LPVSYSGAFKRQLKRLARHNRHIRADIDPVIEQLGAGKTPGDRIRGLDYRLYKVRVRNTASTRGKRGGYRII
jgi:mRNA-degrading endonuclease RelE of RelBE toxin-antitoxin system